MTRTRDMILTEPGALIRRMFRDLDPWFEPRGVSPAAMRKTWGDVPWMPRSRNDRARSPPVH